MGSCSVNGDIGSCSDVSFDQTTCETVVCSDGVSMDQTTCETEVARMAYPLAKQPVKTPAGWLVVSGQQELGRSQSALLQPTAKACQQMLAMWLLVRAMLPISLWKPWSAIVLIHSVIP